MMTPACRTRRPDMPPRVRDQHAEAAVRLLRELSGRVDEADVRAWFEDMAAAVESLRRRLHREDD